MCEWSTGPAPVVTMKFLVTKRCNIACRFCHNEFQGDVLGVHEAVESFDERCVQTLLGDVNPTARLIRIKISGGEPLLQQNEVRNLLKWMTRRDVVERILVSNLAGPVDKFVQQMAALGITEVRANLPSLDKGEYAAVTGSDQARLNRVLERCRRAHAQGVRVRANVVVTDDRLGSIRSFADKYVAKAENEVFDEIAFIVDARSSDQDQLHAGLLKWLSANGSGLVSRQGGRVVRANRGDTAVSVVRCIECDQRESADPELDIYVVAPGRRLAEYRMGRAYLVPEDL